jgi:hypothetical protein
VTAYMKTFDEFLKNPDPRGEVVELSSDRPWICLHKATVTLDGEFTPYELMRIIATFNPKKPG